MRLAPDGKTVLDKGKVVVVDNQVDPTTGTVRMKGEFPNANLQLWPGQFVNVRLLIDSLRQVVVVPTAAVQRGPNGTFVYVVKDDSTVSVRPVSITQQDDREAVVGSGLRPASAWSRPASRASPRGPMVATSAEEAGPARRRRVPRASGAQSRRKRQG